MTFTREFFSFVSQALSEVLPSVAAAKVAAGGFMVLRPDSGDPVEAVLAALEAADKVFGADTNAQGFRVPRGCGVIQGDGINLQTLAAILEAVLDRGYSAEVRQGVLLAGTACMQCPLGDAASCLWMPSLCYGCCWQ